MLGVEGKKGQEGTGDLRAAKGKFRKNW